MQTTRPVTATSRSTEARDEAIAIWTAVHLEQLLDSRPTSSAVVLQRLSLERDLFPVSLWIALESTLHSVQVASMERLQSRTLHSNATVRERPTLEQTVTLQCVRTEGVHELHPISLTAHVLSLTVDNSVLATSA